MGPAAHGEAVVGVTGSQPASGSAIEPRLRAAGLRPTRQRLALASLLLDGRHRHVTAEEIHAEARAAGVKVSLATVYNTLNQFLAAGLLRSVTAEADRSVFDTNIRPHHHFLEEQSGVLIDVADNAIALARLPAPPDGFRIARVDVVIRLEADRPSPDAETTGQPALDAHAREQR